MNYYVDISDELADELQQVDNTEIVEALEQVADKNNAEDSDELAHYDSVKEIRNDS